MVKQAKIHNYFLIAIGLMIFCHLSFVLYQNSRQAPKAKISEAHRPQGGSAKAFGLVLPQERHFSVGSVRELDATFKKCGFDLQKAKTAGKAPRLYLSKLPRDMGKKTRASNTTFIRVLLPHILRVNEEILTNRTRLLALQKRLKAGGHLRQTEKMWLSKLKTEYRCPSTKIEALLVHVDVVPPSLALSQAMIETGGGRSHAALHKNSTFGHMRTKTKVEKFESLHANVKAYVINLNRHAAYKSFRLARAKMRASNQKLCGYTLASGLKKYSVRGPAYIRDVQRQIDAHGLKGYDHITLATSRP